MRKKKVIKRRPIKPDEKFGSPLVTALGNKVMWEGKFGKARRIVYQAAEEIEKKLNLPFMTVFEGALTNIKPAIEMKSRRVGATKQRVPKEIDEARSVRIALRWLVEGAREKRGANPMYKKLAEEIKNAYNKTGEAFKRKEVLYKEAESGRVFSLNR